MEMSMDTDNDHVSLYSNIKSFDACTAYCYSDFAVFNCIDMEEEE